MNKIIKDELIKSFIPLLSTILNIPSTDIVHIGSGRYSLVYGISETKIVKIYHTKKCFRKEYIKYSEYFESGEFRETIFNSFLDHKNLLKCDAVHYDDVIGLYKFHQRMMGT